jgi:O-antigen chain-terminating methyltransferase
MPLILKRLLPTTTLASVQSHESYVDELYRLLLRRPPEPEAAADVVGRLERGLVSRATLAHEIVTSPECARLRALDDAVATAFHARLTNERPRNLTAPPGNDERPIEIAWTLARYRAEARVLDVGYVNAEPAYKEALVAAAPWNPKGIDLVEGEVPGFDGLVGDLRAMPFGTGSFDVVFCISTLEHVGKDNSVYGAGHERDPEGIPQALGELRRVVGRRGRLLLSVPAGADEDHEWFVQRRPEAWRELFARAGLDVFEHELYELFDEGWRSVERVSEDLGYGERGPGASAVLCAELRPRRFRPRVPAALRLGRAG